jgi:hypothetical protein
MPSAARVSSLAVLSPTQVHSACDRIAADFIAQCRHGEQTKRLPGCQAACGRVLRSPSSAQFGLYGTAAALRVLSDRPDDDARTLVPRLVCFLESYLLSPVPPGPSDAKRGADGTNVIKLSEVLYSLQRVGLGIVDVSVLAGHIGSLLINSIREGRGWGYFLEESQPHPLPTAIACRALAAHGYDVSGPRHYLAQRLTTDSRVDGDVFVQVACGYVLASSAADRRRVSSDPPAKTLRGAHDGDWHSLKSLFSTDLEANVEYARGSQHYYVRVPWQLYLIGSARRLRSVRHFASARVQRRLEAAVTGVLSHRGFVYPHSGNEVSARTASILYDLLREASQGPWRLWQALVAVDRARSWLAHVLRVPVAVLAAGFAAYSGVVWLDGSRAAVGDVGPNIAASVIVALCLAGRRPRA